MCEQLPLHIEKFQLHLGEKNVISSFTAGDVVEYSLVYDSDALFMLAIRRTPKPPVMSGISNPKNA
ncbi:hypothetical protein [Methyloglobulus sp.]|uniref:hypothetical protein n=1 Tax=Methyloglobulus sp. TaxID=2518622 RepID=UPI0017C5AFE4|nr:hypothetical protein [Methyloglobulus sp.]